MQIEALLILLLIGAVAGFLAGTIVKGYGFGAVGNIIVGIVGAVAPAAWSVYRRRYAWTDHHGDHWSRRSSHSYWFCAQDGLRLQFSAEFENWFC
jgi:hypothetical protein